MYCNEHQYIVVEAEGTRDSWRAHKLCCSKCLKIIMFKEVLKLNKPTEVEGVTVDQDSI